MEKRQNTFRCVTIYRRPLCIACYNTYNHPCFVSCTNTCLNNTVSGFNLSGTALCRHEGVKIAPAAGRSMMSAPWDPLFLRFTFCQVCKSSLQPGQRCTWKRLAEPRGAADDLNGGRGLDLVKGQVNVSPLLSFYYFGRVWKEAKMVITSTLLLVQLSLNVLRLNTTKNGTVAGWWCSRACDVIDGGKRKSSSCVLIAGNANTILRLSGVNQRILWFVEPARTEAIFGTAISILIKFIWLPCNLLLVKQSSQWSNYIIF